VGDQLPTLQDFMQEYGVSRVTMRVALGELEKEGLIERTRGRGTVVIRDVAQVRWLTLPTEWQALVSHLERLHVRVIELASGARVPAISADEGSAADSYWWTRRVNWTQNAPYSLVSIDIEKSIF